MSDNTPGWQPDPTGKHDHRYWDGSQWTDNVSDAGVAGTDPYDPSALGSAGVATVTDTPATQGPPGWEPTTVTPAPPPPPEPTAAWSAAPGAAAPPPPYTPYGAQGPTGPGGGDGGSKRGLLVGGAILAAVAIAVAAFLLLSGDDESVRDQLASAIQRDSNDTSEKDASCLADYLVDELGEETFRDVDFDSQEAPDEVEEALAAKGPGAIEECDIGPAEPDGGTPTTATTEPTTDTTEGTTDTTEGSTDGQEGGSYGDDPDFDALYDQCEAGDFEACDELFRQSPTGSEYEEFGDTCGNRNEPSGYCVNIYANE